MADTLSVPQQTPNDYMTSGLAKVLKGVGYSPTEQDAYRSAKKLGNLLQATPAGIPQTAYDVGQELGTGAQQTAAGNFGQGAANIGVGLGTATLGAIPGPGILREVPKDNYIKPLSEYAQKLYHETSGDRALHIIDPNMNRIDIGSLYLADHPDMATGQGANKGVMLHFDPSGIQGRINTAKPAWELPFTQGMGEYQSRNTTQDQFNKALTGFTIQPNLQVTPSIKSRLRITLDRLQKNGWSKATSEDGSVHFTPPTPVDPNG